MLASVGLSKMDHWSPGKKQHNNVKLKKNEYVPPIKFTLAQKRNGTISKQIRIVVNVTWYIYYIFFLIPDQ